MSRNMNNNKLLIITSYPVRGQVHGVKTVGVASYTKNILLAIKQNLKFIILAEKFNNKKEIYQEQGIEVRRIWQRNNLLSLLSLMIEVLSVKTKKIVISYEKNMVGGNLANIFFLLLLPISKLFQRQIYIILHQAVEKFENLETNKLKIVLLQFFKDLLYYYLVIFSNKIILFEDKLAQNLPQNHKTIIIPHAVENFKAVSKEQARKKLNLLPKDFYILYFGFLSPYKGVEWLINQFKVRSSKFKVDKRKLIVAGGINPNHRDKKEYQDYVKKIKQAAKASNGRILTTGFVKEEAIPLYFSAADAVVLPYKAFFSSSGPLSLAFSFEKPVLLSKPLEGYFESKDFKFALLKSGLKKKNLLFTFDGKDFSKKIEFLKDNDKRFVLFSRTIKEKRSWKNIIKEYQKKIYE